MPKVSVAGVCREVLEACGVQMTLAELHAACVAAGLDVLEAQVLAGVQSMASTGKCDRGTEPRTYIKLGAGRGAGEGRAEADPDAPPRVRVAKVTKSEQRTFPTDGVLAELEAVLGAPSPRPTDRLAHCFVLLGDWGCEDILVRTRSVLQQEPKNWFTYMQGPNTVVGFTI